MRQGGFSERDSLTVGTFDDPVAANGLSYFALLTSIAPAHGTRGRQERKTLLEDQYDAGSDNLEPASVHLSVSCSIKTVRSQPRSKPLRLLQSTECNDALALKGRCVNRSG